MDKQTGSISVMSELGDRVDDGQLVVRGRTLSVGLIESDVTGTFSVSWRAVAQDGHPVEGKFSFAITPKATASPLVAPPTSLVTTSESISDKKTSFYVISLTGSIMILGIAAIISLRRRN